MKLVRTAALVGVAKKVYDEARKPENQARIKRATETARRKLQERQRRR